MIGNLREAEILGVTNIPLLGMAAAPSLSMSVSPMLGPEWLEGELDDLGLCGDSRL